MVMIETRIPLMVDIIKPYLEDNTSYSCHVPLEISGVTSIVSFKVLKGLLPSVLIFQWCSPFLVFFSVKITCPMTDPWDWIFTYIG